MIPFRTILIIGVGLIGGSLSRSLRKAGYSGHIIGIDRSEESLRRALELGLIDEAASDLPLAVAKADFILIAAPVAQTGRLLESIRPHLKTDALISDVGSTKTNVVAAAYTVLGDEVSRFIPAHPIAGRELNGPDAAVDDLYEGKKVVITALPENAAEDVGKVEWVWKSCGGIIHRLTPEAHDAVFATVSHLPHLLSYALVDQVARDERAKQFFQYAASGFRDFTRIAGSSPEMWRDIAVANREALLDELDTYIANLKDMRDSLASSDAAALEATFTRAQQARMKWIADIEAAEKEEKTA